MNIAKIDISNKSVIKKMKDAGIYGSFIASIKSAPDKYGCFVFRDYKPEKVVYYIYFRGFENPIDNGYQSITVDNPVLNHETVEIVEQMIEDKYFGGNEHF